MSILNYFRLVEGKSLAFFARDDIDQPIVSDLIPALRSASYAANKNARICFHTSPEAPYHDMIVIEWKSLSTLGLHRHPTKPESLQIIDGEMYLDLGQRTGKYLYVAQGVHIPPMTWHATRPYTDCVIYREIKPGPFHASDNELWITST